MRENNRNSIEKCRKKLPQFTTMNVIDGQAGLVNYSSLIFYSPTIDNILNIILLLILVGISIVTLNGDNSILKRTTEAKNRIVYNIMSADVEEEYPENYILYANYETADIKRYHRIYFKVITNMEVSEIQVTNIADRKVELSVELPRLKENAEKGIFIYEWLSATSNNWKIDSNKNNGYPILSWQ